MNRFKMLRKSRCSRLAWEQASEFTSRVHLTDVNKFPLLPPATNPPPSSRIINCTAIVKDRDKPTSAINQQGTVKQE